MPKEYNCNQGEADWMLARLGKVTASEMHNLLTPTLQLKKDKEKVSKYLYMKLAEAHRMKPLPGFSSWTTDRGEELEMDARKWYKLRNETHKLRTVGFIEHDDGRCGCSPDSLINEDGGLELKCPEPTNHVKYLVEGKLPDDYAAQVHMSLYVTGRAWWRFMSYASGFPKFVLTVQRDEKICATIAEALAGFYKRFDEAMAKLREAA